MRDVAPADSVEGASADSAAQADINLSGCRASLAPRTTCRIAGHSHDLIRD